MKRVTLAICSLSILFLSSCQKEINDTQLTGTVKFTFKNMVKADSMVLNSSNYTNGFGEQFTISKFKYYISHAMLKNAAGAASDEGYYLIDASNAGSMSFSFEVPVDIYSSVAFLLGVDSTHNVSGAQTGALDPLNDMFWTWNSGYIMAKMEGNSPQSAIVNNKVEYHIGGFTGPYSALKNINLIIPPTITDKVEVREGKTSEIFINADFDKWWQGFYDLKITDLPSVTHPGVMAKSISDNYSKMFSIGNIINY